MNIVAIILARGGSKGIPKKNIIDFCGKPLIAWTIEQCQNAKEIQSVWVSSDSDEILEISKQSGAKSILRPEILANDTSTSESGWLHAIDEIESINGKVDLIVAPQVTSPLRHSKDISKGIQLFFEKKFDSMFSSSLAEDLYFWERKSDGSLESVK